MRLKSFNYSCRSSRLSFLKPNVPPIKTGKIEVLINILNGPFARLDKSRSQRILWLLQELNVPYTLKTFKRQKDMLAPPELKEVHPLGKSPVITVSSEATNGKTINIAESSNIIEYLIAHFGQHLEPQRWQQGKDGEVGGETEGWLRYRYLMHYAEGSLMPLIVTALLFRSMSTLLQSGKKTINEAGNDADT